MTPILTQYKLKIKYILSKFSFSSWIFLGRTPKFIYTKRLKFDNAGFTDKQWATYMKKGILLQKWANVPLPDKLPQKVFKKCHEEIPTLPTYWQAQDSEYWGKWTKRTYDELTPAMSWICPNKLWDIARELNYIDKYGRLERAMSRLQGGADIGCKGDGRLPTNKPNSESANVYGVRVADSLQSWIKEGLCFGPLLPSEMPWAEYTVNPITVKLKPNGKARICINMSAPYPKPSDPPGTPASVNSGINADEFPTKMSSTQTFLESLMLAGCPAEMCKLDWNQAYKHIAVRKEDHSLQVFQFCGRLFGELMLTFGGGSSAGIYDDTAKLVKDLAILASKTDPRMVNQVLDDVVACGSRGDKTVNNFYRTYREVAERVGVSLADETDVDKAFPASHKGKVLGITYDLENWVWSLSEDKLTPLVHMLNEIITNDTVENRLAMSLNGKLNHYMWLVDGGPWQRGFLLRLQCELKPPGYRVKVDKLAKDQARWWIVSLRAGAEVSRIPDPRGMGSMDPVIVFTDAAGGDSSKIKNGIGGFCPPNDWFYMPWSDLIRTNRPNTDGTKFAHKMCSLEGLGVLVGLATIPDRARNKEVQFFCDNSSFVAAYKKKHSSCAYAYTIAKAVHDVGVGLGSAVKVLKTKRCSGQGEVVADSLSKGDWEKAWPLMPNKNEDPGRIPKSILKWVANPVKDMDLGYKILTDMMRYTKVLHIESK